MSILVLKYIFVLFIAIILAIVVKILVAKKRDKDLTHVQFPKQLNQEVLMASSRRILLLSLALILIGIFLLLITASVLTLKNGWPLILILVGVLIYIFQDSLNRTTEGIKSPSQDNSNKILINSQNELERMHLLELVKQDFLRWIKRYSIILTVLISLIGFFGVRSYVDSVFTDVKVQSEIAKKSLYDLNIGLEKVSNFTMKVDSLEKKLVMVDDLSNQLDRKVIALNDTTERLRRTVQKDWELNERRISSLNNLLRPISQESIELQRAFDQYRETAAEIDSEKIMYKENSNYTITINYSRRNEAKALRYEKTLQNLGFKVRKELLTDARLILLRRYSNRVTYNGRQNLLTKGDEIIQKLSLRDFQIERDPKHPESDFLLTVWLLD